MSIDVEIYQTLGVCESISGVEVMQVRVLKGWKPGGYVKCGKIWKVERLGLNLKDRAVMMAVVMMMMMMMTTMTMMTMMTMMMTMTTMMTMMMMMTTMMMTFVDDVVRKKKVLVFFFSHLC